MARFFKDRQKATGEAPGSLIFIGSQKMEKPRIRMMDFSADHLKESELNSIEQIIPYLVKPSISWINIDGLHDSDTIGQLGELLNIHPLILEDIVNTDNRPKLDEDDEHITLIMKILGHDQETSRIYAEQFSFILGQNYLVTFQEQVGTHFESVRDRIRNNRGRIRISGPDYLAYTLIDSLIDKYMLIVADIGNKIEILEENIYEKTEPEVAQEIFRHKTEMIYLRKSIFPLREIMTQLLKSESHLISKKIHKFFLDLNELIIMTNEMIETYQALISDQLNIYNTNITNKTNETVKVLTIFAAIFIPLTFLAGIYGMNFDYLPELHLRYGYLFFWIIVLLIMGFLLFFFRKKKWF